MTNPNFNPFFAAELNKIMGTDYVLKGAYTTKNDEEVYTSALVSSPTKGETRLIIHLNDGSDDTVHTNYLLKDKPLSLKNASTRFLTSVQMLTKWLDALLTSGTITVQDVVFHAEDTTKIIGMHAPAIIAVFMSRCNAPARGRSSSQNVLILDFAKGKRAAAVKAEIAKLLLANDLIATVYDAKEYATKRKSERAAKAKPVTA